MSLDKRLAEGNKIYLENHRLNNIIQDMMGSLLRDKPDVPLDYMIKFLHKTASKQGVPVTSPNDRRSYDRPWTNNTSKRNSTASITNSPACVTMESRPMIQEITDISTEFQLVTEEPKPTEEDVVMLDRTKESTKEKLTNMLEDEKLQEELERKKLDEIVQQKENESEHVDDDALEIAEDPDLYRDEFGVSSKMVQKGSGVFVKRDPLLPVAGNPGLHFNFCVNCARMYNSLQTPNSKCSSIIDDLESASQVQGQRFIPHSTVESPTSNTSANRKLISVSDIGHHSKPWPVVEAVPSDAGSVRSSVRQSRRSNNLPQ